jgi:hypothetical protein
MNDCLKQGCTDLTTTCNNCGRKVMTSFLLPLNTWILTRHSLPIDDDTILFIDQGGNIYRGFYKKPGTSMKEGFWHVHNSECQSCYHIENVIGWIESPELPSE